MLRFYAARIWRSTIIKYVILLSTLSAALYMLYTPALLQRGTPAVDIDNRQRAVWLDQANTIPTEEYSALLKARFKRPSAWPNYTPSKWQATQSQQEELNMVIREALINGKDGCCNSDGDRQTTQERRERISAAVKYTWEAYRRDALGYDEFRPLSHSGTNMTRQGIGYFVAD
ncbi:mannosyl-oligosaccharide alpha-1,2-mannosidase, partial [Coemansia sp. Benny D160-2]